jgi:hypothetical protein
VVAKVEAFSKRFTPSDWREWIQVTFRMLMWEKVPAPFGKRFCRFWGEVELEFHTGLFDDATPYYRLKSWTGKSYRPTSAGRIAREVFTPAGARPIDRYKFQGDGNPAGIPSFYLDRIASVQGPFPSQGAFGSGVLIANGNGVEFEWRILERRADPPSENSIWVGLGLKYGGTAGLVGAEACHGLLWQLGTGRPCYYQTQTARVGIGLGAATGSVVAIAVAKNISSLTGATSEGLDFSIALGKNWSGFVKGANSMGPAWDLLKGMKAWLATKKGSAQVVKAAVRAGAPVAISSDQFTSLANLGKTLCATSGLDENSEGLSLFDIPVEGPGLEIAIYNGFQTIDWVQPL